jgi:predicted alpha/beta superfamily hydrolase
LTIGYSSTNKFYPVLYVLDGDMAFGLTKGIADLLMFGKEIKDIIVIGISYGQGTDIWIKNRSRDYTPSVDTFVVNGQFMQTGGADNFLKFIQFEYFNEFELLLPIGNAKVTCAFRDRIVPFS